MSFLLIRSARCARTPSRPFTTSLRRLNKTFTDEFHVDHAHSPVQQPELPKPTPLPNQGDVGPWTPLDQYPVVVYKGPVAKAFKNLKAFSLTSLVISTSLSPFIFILEAPLSFAGRLFLAGCAISTTIISTAMIGWCSSPYVNTIELLEPKTEENPTPAIRLLTYTTLLQARYTTLTTPLFIHDSPRPLSTWSLAPPKYAPEEAYPDIVAQTEDKTGKILGRWDGETEEGRINRVFMVHEDLLEGKWGLEGWRSRKGGDRASR